MRSVQQLRFASSMSTRQNRKPGSMRLESHSFVSSWNRPVWNERNLFAPSAAARARGARRFAGAAGAEYAEHDGLGLAELVRNKEVTPSELLEAARARIEAGNPTINAVVHRMYDQARAAVAGGLPDGPFRGGPFLLKDLGAKYAGVPTGAGNRLLRDIPAPLDSEIVRRYKAAGVVILGKTNTPEFGLVPFTEPAVAGPTRNPWDLGRTPGGSSGGSAAAVAARMGPLAGGGGGGR